MQTFKFSGSYSKPQSFFIFGVEYQKQIATGHITSTDLINHI